VKWSEATLGEIAERGGGFIQTGPFGSQLHQADYQSEGVPVVMPKDIAEGRVSTESVARIGEEKANRLARHKLKPRTIVLPRRGEITKRAFIGEEQEGWLCGTGCLKIELGEGDLLPEFLYYFMEQGHVVRWLEQHAVGTTMLNLNTQIVADLPVRYPSTQAQQEIASILSAYDDLIENNRRRIALLEGAARLLYEEWFVRFKFPCFAKATQGKPGRERTRIVNGVPEGWERVPMPDAIHINPLTRLSDEEDHWYVEMADLATNSMVIQDMVKRDGRSGSKFTNGDTLLARITPCLENGKTGYVDFMAEGEVGRGSTEFIVLRARRVTPEFVYCFARTYAFREHAIKSMVGASGRQRVQERCFDEFRVLVPPATLMTLFADFAAPCFRQIKTLHSQNQKLRAARDLLLPRLMSGEIAV